jgi:hypothetical protein
VRRTVLTALFSVLLWPGVVWAGPVVEYRVDTVDLANNPITAITVGNDFKYRVFVQDIREPPFPYAGVFGAYLSVGYDADRVAISGARPVFFSGFSQVPTPENNVGAGEYDVLTSGSDGLVVAGSIRPDFLHTPGSTPQLLYTLQMHASAPGVVAFTPSDDQLIGDFVTIFYNVADDDPPAVPREDVRYVGTSLTIVDVPEPASIALAAFALIGLTAAAWRKRRKV